MCGGDENCSEAGGIYSLNLTDITRALKFGTA